MTIRADFIANFSYILDVSHNVVGGFVLIEPADIALATLSAVSTSFAMTFGSFDPDNGVFPDFVSCATYLQSQGALNDLISQINTSLSNGYHLGNLIYITQPTQDAIDAKQDLNGNLTALAGLTVASGKIPYGSGTAAYAQVDSTSYGRGLLNLTNQAALQTAVGDVPTAISILTLSLVGSGATGTQISSTKRSSVRTTVSTSATANIAGSASSTVSLKICSTNNSTEANWTTVGTANTNAAYSLAIAIQGVNGAQSQICADVPAGWYCKLVNTGTGTHSEGFIAGQQTIYG